MGGEGEDDVGRELLRDTSSLQPLPVDEENRRAYFNPWASNRGCFCNYWGQLSASRDSKNQCRMTKKRKNSTFTTGVAMAGFIGGIICSAFLFSGFMSVQKPPFGDLRFDFATTITIVLSALSIILTALAIIIAVVGVFGFGLLRTEASNAARDHANEQLGEDGELRSIIEKRVNTLVAQYQGGRVSNSDFPNPESEYGE
jgi:hypothetical protein